MAPKEKEDAPSPESTTTKATEEKAPAAGTVARPAIIHNKWDRVCHPVPKCETCGKKGGIVGVLQRCHCNKVVICQGCFEAGALDEMNSISRVWHVIEPGQLDWSPASKEEKALKPAKTKQDAVKAAEENLASKRATRSVARRKTKAATRAVAVKGSGLHRDTPAAEDNKIKSGDRTPGTGLSSPATVTAIYPHSSPQDHGPWELRPRRKRQLSPTLTHASPSSTVRPEPAIKGEPENSTGPDCMQNPDKRLKIPCPPRTPPTNLPPIRDTMEPKLAVSLPSLSHLHSGPSRTARLESFPPPSPYPFSSPLRSAPISHSPEFGHLSPPPAAARGTADRPGESARHHQQRDHFNAPAALMELRYSTSPAQAFPPPRRLSLTSESPRVTRPPTTLRQLNAPTPPAQDTTILAADLYQDTLRTKRDYPAWPLPSCLLHEVSRSWSRGALRDLAASIGLVPAFDVLLSVTHCVTHWLSLRESWELHDWLAREKVRVEQAMT